MAADKNGIESIEVTKAERKFIVDALATRLAQLSRAAKSATNPVIANEFMNEHNAVTVLQARFR